MKERDQKGPEVREILYSTVCICTMVVTSNVKNSNLFLPPSYLLSALRFLPSRMQSSGLLVVFGVSPAYPPSVICYVSRSRG